MIVRKPWMCRLVGHVWRGNIRELDPPNADIDRDDSYLVHTVCMRCGIGDKIRLHAAPGVASSLEAIDGDTTL